ncbi:hypothetical protein [Rossellomorea sp. NS-SX7]|uniref:hypothetical protein n=1 Tax=Rossellomorea sp. NS-SX7 TaxID=3463856 RepID=UPI004057DAE7
MKRIEEHWDENDRKLLYQTVKKELEQGKTVEKAFNYASRLFNKPAEQCRHVYLKYEAEHGYDMRDEDNKKVVIKGDESIVNPKPKDFDLLSEMIEAYKSGNTITNSIKAVSEKHGLNFVSVKGRWYKLMKDEEFRKKFNEEKDKFDKNLTLSTSVSKDKQASKKEDVPQINQDNEKKNSFIDMQINFFNEFYQNVKNDPEVLSKLDMYKDMSAKTTELENKLKKIHTISKHEEK